MIRSMTAFASLTAESAGQTRQWEMRGVNARGLDIRLRLPEGNPALEAALRGRIAARLTRGNVGVTLKTTQTDAGQPLVLDPAQLDRVLAALDQVQNRAMAMGITLGQPTAADVLGQRGVILRGAGEDMAEAVPDTVLLEEAERLLDAFCAMRTTEGTALAGVLAEQLNRIEALVARAAQLAHEREAEQREGLRAAMARVLADVGEADPARLAQELAVIAVKTDVTEEIDRLQAHVAAARGILAEDVAQGRRLDFLAQEFNREANTLCAKSHSVPLTQVGLDLKAVIDQMREQVQNVE